MTGDAPVHITSAEKKRMLSQKAILILAKKWNLSDIILRTTSSQSFWRPFVNKRLGISNAA
jgi:hypothetical protein